MKKLLYFLFVGANFALFAQKTDSTKALEEITIQATRSSGPVPYAISRINLSRLQIATQQLGMHEVLGGVAGLWALNADNYTQDLRLSIRGFGSRAAFGIRGIKLLVDGLPEGTPDGQVDVDNLDMSLMESLEVVKGTISGIYGNAAGGVLSLKTLDPFKNHQIKVGLTAGSFGMTRAQVTAATHYQKWGIIAAYSNTELTGYRDWSAMKNQVFQSKILYKPNAFTELKFIFNKANSPMSNDPGGLDSLSFENYPKQAFANNRAYQVGETVEQSKVGLQYQFAKSKWAVEAHVFKTQRSLNNRLAVFTNGLGQLHRDFVGLGWSVERIFTKLKVKIGNDNEYQRDHRQRFSYQRNSVFYTQNALVLDQLEAFYNQGFYQSFHLNICQNLHAYGGYRFDKIKIFSEDRFLTDGDQSGQKTYAAHNFQAGLNAQIAKGMHTYAQVSSGFETPTLNELSNNPELTGGFNNSLLPQKSRSLEWGLKTNRRNFKADVSLFRIMTQNDVVAFQLPSQGTRSFYKNAGKSQRMGIELQAEYQIVKGLSIYSSEALGRFSYKEFTSGGQDFSGKILPGIPQFFGQNEIRFANENGWMISTAVRHQSKIATNDANTSWAKAATTVQLKASKLTVFGKTEVEKFIGVNNLCNVHYAGNVLINAQNKRFFEAAQPRNFYAGLKFAFK